MPGLDSPLQVIKQKELELRQQIEAARQKAEARILEARDDAEQIVCRADDAGCAEAASQYRDGIEQARREAETIAAQAIEETAALRRLATARLDEVAELIVELVYAPFDGEGADHRDEAMPG